jgi:hypothetical protein
MIYKSNDEETKNEIDNIHMISVEVENPNIEKISINRSKTKIK